MLASIKPNRFAVKKGRNRSITRTLHAAAVATAVRDIITSSGARRGCRRRRMEL